QFVFKAFRKGECSDPLDIPEEGLTSSFEAFTTELRRLRSENQRLESEYRRLDTYIAKLQPEFEEKARWANSLNQELGRLRAQYRHDTEMLSAMWRKATRGKRIL